MTAQGAPRRRENPVRKIQQGGGTPVASTAGNQRNRTFLIVVRQIVVLRR
jgi:hypothetical protein